MTVILVFRRQHSWMLLQSEIREQENMQNFPKWVWHYHFIILFNILEGLCNLVKWRLILVQESLHVCKYEVEPLAHPLIWETYLNCKNSCGQMYKAFCPTTDETHRCTRAKISISTHSLNDYWMTHDPGPQGLFLFFFMFWWAKIGQFLVSVDFFLVLKGLGVRKCSHLSSCLTEREMYFPRVLQELHNSSQGADGSTSSYLAPKELLRKQLQGSRHFCITDSGMALINCREACTGRSHLKQNCFPLYVVCFYELFWEPMCLYKNLKMFVPMFA